MAAKKTAKKAVKKTAKKGVKKSAARKAVKKTAAKKSTAKKSTARKAVKKSAAKKRTSSSISIPPVPVSSRPSAPTTRAAAPISSAPRPVAKKSGSGNRVVLAILVGIVLLGAIVLSQGKDGDDGAAPKIPTKTESATPAESASESASETSTATGNGVAPLGIVAHYTADGATIFWKESEVTDGLSGYSIETRANGGEWKKIGEVEMGTLKYDVKVTDTAGWMSFRISAVYSDGQVAAGKVFGLPGQYE